jgi:putative nucleotidyltransferase with HDIG domain
MLALFTIGYFSLNSWLVAIAVHTDTGMPVRRIWREHLLWLALNYIGGASVAALLVPYTRHVDLTYIAVIVPLLVIQYLTFRATLGRVEDALQHVSDSNVLYMSTIETLAMAIDAKDQVTHGHIRRVQGQALELAHALGMEEGPRKALEAAALLHDMGKLAVPEYILNKPGALTAPEFERMKLHANIGADILKLIPFPYPVVPIVRHHHENWDGSGYPDGLRGTDIPIGARILSVVDCFDALTSDRPYRPRVSNETALRIVTERSGTMYDPAVVDAFVQLRFVQSEASYPGDPASDGVGGGRGIIVAAHAGGETPFDEITASAEEMLTVYEFARNLPAHTTLSHAGDALGTHLRRVIPHAVCALFLVDRTTNDVVATHVVGQDVAWLQNLRIERGHGISGWVAANRQTVANADAALDLGDHAHAHLSGTQRVLRRTLSTPVVSQQELIGVLTLYGTADQVFSDQHQRLIEVVAGQVSDTIRRLVERAPAGA